MKKVLLFSLLLIAAVTRGQDQVIDDIQGKNELKWNATNLIIFTFLDGSYEYLINEESSLGVGVLVNLGDDIDLNEYRTFSVTPYYRQYFSRKYAKGFFVEAFGMLNTGEEEFELIIFDPNSPVISRQETRDYTDFAIGLSIGGKFVTQRGFVAELYLGIGRNLLNNSFDQEFVGRGGVSLGYRF